jgi:RNA methyltransferase, TrmH family
VASNISSECLRVMADVRRVATAKGRAGVGAFLVEGRRMLERGLRAGWRPRELLVGESASQGQLELELLLGKVAALGCPCRSVPDKALLDLAQGRHSGLLTALFDLPGERPVAEILTARPRPALFLVLVDVEEPGNVGALIRTALASDAAGVICVGSSDPFHPKAVRTSLGSLFKIALARLDSSRDLLETLRAFEVHSLAAVARDGASLDRAAWPAGSIALLVGNEGQGLSEGLRRNADGRVSIDLSEAADSFCVNAAAAVCLYEVQRRWRFPA